MAPICTDCKWLGFPISDPIQNLDYSGDPKTGHVRFSNGRPCPDLEWRPDASSSNINLIRYCLPSRRKSILKYKGQPDHKDPALSEIRPDTRIRCQDSQADEGLGQGWPKHCPGAKKCPPRLFHVPSKLFFYENCIL